MATAQLVRKKVDKQKIGTWSSVFPVEQVTQQQSTLFVKKLLAVAVSNITYLRTIFPEHAFGDRCLEDLNLKILRDDSACPGACQVIKWVKGCFDALDKKYLRMIVMSIYRNEKEPDAVVESYTFKFSYTTDRTDDSISIYRNGTKLAQAASPNETRKATTTLLRTIVVLTQTLKPLPDEALMTMKLFYYDEVTPPDYEPPGFKAGEDTDDNFINEPMNINVGDIYTPFHSVKLRIKTSADQFVCEDGGVKDEGTQDNDGDITVEQELDTAIASTNNNSIATEPSPMEQADINEDAPSPPLLGKGPPVDTDSLIVKCPCGYNEDEGLMVACESCHYWQHANCFGLRTADDVPELHYCDLCHKAGSGSICTDIQLVKMGLSERRFFCLWRRLLLLCLKIPRIIPYHLVKKMSVSSIIAQRLVARLEEEGFVKAPKRGNGRLWKVILKDVIESVALKKYFKTEVDSPLEKTQTRRRSNKSDKDEASNKGVTVEQLTVKTSSMNLKQSNDKSAPDTAANTSVDDGKNPDPPVVRRSPRLAAKRPRSLVDPTVEFQLSNSQDIIDLPQETGRVKKRRKISIVSKVLLV